MATSAHNLRMPSPASQPSCYDSLDIDSFINYDPTMSASPSLSPHPPSSTSTSTSNSSFTNQNSSLLLSPPTTQQTFAGPSHQYDDYKQLAGLPVGALANTVAVNQADSLSFGHYYGAPATNTIYRMNGVDEMFDFGTAPSHSPSFSLPQDIDMDFGSPQDIFVSSMDSAYVDPLSLGREEETITQPPATGRAWVGMHQQQAAQQAALAKAQAHQKQQQALAQQQKQEASAQQGQKATSHQPRRANGSTRPPTDPVVEERISRLLNHMRQSSVQSSNDEDATTPTAHGSSQSARARKDEEDMDEDERLLASEEGKKLSSKERRQLRNKVSARAFRSRRKEYIGQLEGEIAAKATEADDLKAKNEELVAENTRLTDLTRMLLSSPAFSVFLNDLSGNGVTIPRTSATRSESNVKSEQIQILHKDVNPHQAVAQKSSQQVAPQIGMALIPETSIPEIINYTTFNPTNSIYTDDMDLYNAQVFTVTELPQGPAVDQIDTCILSGKSSDAISSYPIDDDCKDNMPAIERMPSPDMAEITTIHHPLYDNMDESDPSLDLFDNCSSPVTTSHLTEDPIFGHIELEKAFDRLDLVVEGQMSDQSTISAATMEKFERLCSRLEAASERISNIVPYLSNS